MRALLLLLVALPLLSGCSEQSWRTKDISGLMPALEFELTDENGRTVSAEQYRGRLTLLFFGFANCPDVCPTTLARLASASSKLPERVQERLRVLFVSVDPARDSPEKLRRYTKAFGPEFIGLTGSKDALDALTRRYRVTYGYGEKDQAGNYQVSHSSAVFAFDREGEARLLIRDSDSIEAVTADLQQLSEAG